MRKLLVLVLFIACTNSADKQLLEKSNQLHLEALAFGKQAFEGMEELETLVSKLDSASVLIYQDSIRQYQESYEYWVDNNVEVPGFEHDHEEHDHSGQDHDDHEEHDHSGHHHDHGPAVQLTPEMMLEVQTELKTQIEDLSARVQVTLKALDN